MTVTWQLRLRGGYVAVTWRLRDVPTHVTVTWRLRLRGGYVAVARRGVSRDRKAAVPQSASVMRALFDTRSLPHDPATVLSAREAGTARRADASVACL